MSSTVEVSPKAELNAGGVVVKVGDININFLTINSNTKLDRASAEKSKTHPHNSGNKPLAEPDKRRPEPELTNVRVDQYIRTVVFSNADGNFSIPSLSKSKSNELLVESNLIEPLSEKIDGVDGTTFKYGTTKLFVYNKTTKLNGLPGYDSVAKHTMVDVIKESMNTERFVLVKRKILAGRPSQDDLIIEADNGRTFFLDWPINKLGDGTYGVVYAANDGRKRYAVKILYERQFATRTGFISTTEKLLGIACPIIHSADNEQSDKQTSIHYAELIRDVLKSIHSQISMNPQQIDSVIANTSAALDELMAQSDQATNLAKARFEHERDVSKKIYEHSQNTLLEYQDSNAFADRPNDENQFFNNVPSHYVEVVASTSDFQKNNAYRTIIKTTNTLTTSDAKTFRTMQL